jgi:CO dehydrogenase maturation factor
VIGLGKTYAISGKGGVGKTTIAAMMVSHLQKTGTVLAIDADPNANLNELLGVPMGQTLGSLREGLLDDADNIPGGMSKVEYVKYQLQMALVEGDNFDFLAMGRQEGPGCYCYVNNLLRTFMDGLADKYGYVVMDNEAGMEHLSRRTTRNVDCLFVVSDATKIGISTATRIRKLAEEMSLNIKSYALVVNRVNESFNVADLGRHPFENVKTIPFDPAVERLAVQGAPLMSIPAGSRAFKAVGELLSSARTWQHPT